MKQQDALLPGEGHFIQLIEAADVAGELNRTIAIRAGTLMPGSKSRGTGSAAAGVHKRALQWLRYKLAGKKT